VAVVRSTVRWSTVVRDTAVLSGGAPVASRLDEGADAMRVVAADLWGCSTAPRASGNGEERRPELRCWRCESGP
jgi:hypothetical protein